jgi:REP element-mobilizing transposase RayT
MIIRPNEYEYRRNLPHYIKVDRPLFVTFKTHQNWILPEQAREIAFNSCLYFHPKLISLLAAVVMPDHVHMLFKLRWHPDGEPVQLKEILGPIKGYAAHAINKLLRRRGSVWQEESFDHVVRCNSVAEKIEYLRFNPVHLGLVRVPSDYPWLWWAGHSDRTG